ncbi:uncharacterized protein PV09_00698 [Verruconis gallopava]|uniref:mRNA N(6)-methyladenine demethylase n=1 Tax=Verruconis gallopava TaxID=253628 RepID=A0A0D2AQF9_9PEZI|nr:uncharacterized protein PV09_00698 [Verruconis gallopava]KIW08760.1 hypothetical protein PV09_00698 [Verruconis gallopava]
MIQLQRFKHGKFLRDVPHVRLVQNLISMDVSAASSSSSSSSVALVEQSGDAHHHDRHAIPPMFIQKAHWHYSTVKKAALDLDEDVVDFRRGLTLKQKNDLKIVGSLSAKRLETVCSQYIQARVGTSEAMEGLEDVTIYEHNDFPGLQILPGLLPPEIQQHFTSQILHNELANERHKNNLMPDYNIPYPGPRSTQRPTEFKSFFTYPQNSSTGANLVPKTPESAKSLNMAQFLTSKLRWLTIGDQYDWPTRTYTRGGPSTFPPDLAGLVNGLFPHIRPESGVVLLYSGKDYMPVHRDVSEECHTALASFSLGCDGIFIVARGEDDGEGENRPRTVAIRVRSGDCIHLDKETRWAWHAMARTISGTCPDFLSQWPKGTPGATLEEKKAYEKWNGYMSGKRLNVSCRQVWE